MNLAKSQSVFQVSLKALIQHVLIYWNSGTRNPKDFRKRLGVDWVKIG